MCRRRPLTQLFNNLTPSKPAFHDLFTSETPMDIFWRLGNSEVFGQWNRWFSALIFFFLIFVNCEFGSMSDTTQPTEERVTPFYTFEPYRYIQAQTRHCPRGTTSCSYSLLIMQPLLHFSSRWNYYLLGGQENIYIDQRY